MLNLFPNVVPPFLKKPSPAVIWRKPTPSVRPNLHLKLSGIYQSVFLNQWGLPEFRLGLGRLAGFFRLDFLFLNREPNEVGECVAWIYEKRNLILFFKNNKLILHFRWNEFKERWKRPKDEIDSWLARRFTPSISTAFS